MGCSSHLGCLTRSSNEIRTVSWSWPLGEVPGHGPKPVSSRTKMTRDCFSTISGVTWWVFPWAHIHHKRDCHTLLFSEELPHTPLVKFNDCVNRKILVSIWLWIRLYYTFPGDNEPFGSNWLMFASFLSFWISKTVLCEDYSWYLPTFPWKP